MIAPPISSSVDVVIARGKISIDGDYCVWVDDIRMSDLILKLELEDKMVEITIKRV